MSILGSVGYDRYMSDIDYTPLLTLQTKPVYNVNSYDSIRYEQLAYTNRLHSPFCPVYYVTHSDTVSHVSGVSHRWTETRYFFN